MSNFSKVVKFFTQIMLIAAMLTLSSVAHSQYRQLRTKKQQIQALEGLVDLIEYQYGGLEWKEVLYGFKLDKKFAQYKKYILDAQTLDEAKGIVPVEEREILSPKDLRYLLIGLISELHDGHVSLTQFSGDASTLGIRTAALHGKLLVSSLNEKLLKPISEEFELLPYDEIIEIDGKPIDFFKRRNLNYVSNGTIEARKDEAIERIIEIPHALIPPLSKKPTSKIKFRRGNQEFTNEYSWTTIDAIDLTRPVYPMDGGRSGEIFESDEEFIFGVKGSVRSTFMEGLYNLVDSQPEGEETVGYQDLGYAINLALSTQFLNSAKAIADSAFNNQLEGPISREDIATTISGMAQLMPVERIKAFIIEEEDKKPVALIRVPSYSPPGGFGAVLGEIAYISTIIGILKETEVETLIIDQGTNPGGYVAYVHLLLKFFATPDEPLIGQKIQYLLNEILFDSYLSTDGLDSIFGGEDQDPEERRAYLEFIHKQMESGQRITTPLRFNLDTNLSIEDDYGEITTTEDATFWDRNLVVISDSRSASGAEFFPAVLQDNERALIIGDGKSMGLGNPVLGHISTLQRAEMEFRCPFATCERFNSQLQYIEGLGVDPDVHRSIRVEDLHDGLKDNARDILTAAQSFGDGSSAKEIQIELNKKTTLNRAKKILEDDSSLSSQGVTRVISAFRKEISGLNKKLEKDINPWLSAYTRLFDSLEELESAGLVPHDAWDLIAIPLPKDLTESDPVLMTSTRKDVVLRRLEEMLESGALKDKPNTTALVKNLFSNAYRIQGFFHFNEPCELLFE